MASEKKEPKQYSIFPLIAFGVLAYFIYTSLNEKPEISEPIKKDFSIQKQQVVELFKGEGEPTAKDALWATERIFKVGVVSDGANRNGYANYVCETLYEYGFKGENKVVQIIDIHKLVNNKEWVELGQATCT